MILSLALLAMAQVTEPVPTEEEIVVIARRLDEISASVGRDDKGRYHCSLSGSTGLARLDDRLCRAVTRCVQKGASDDQTINQCVAASKPKLIAQIRKEARKKK
ncbi:hypothetical protein K5P26_01995 [Sphingopyxis sp. XHP0097]|uniref:UrcA family protein n=1 Tax=Sphingopyxis jiangsuensis TaxID=2871171 RepID=A0ABS7MA66_9SPHN|nr:MULTISPECIES: hypothetical protein [Sphingopyxis]MBY4635910.1 hypothetical protein [Sphingopyxis jiangsuensis]